MKIKHWVMSVGAVLALAGCTSGTAAGRGPSTESSPASADVRSAASPAQHIVIVMMENHSYSDIIGSRQAPYLNALARHGANLTAMRAVTHPSQPNYLALFSGSRQKVIDDRCPLPLTGDNLAVQLRRAGNSFVGYSEGLPRTGSQVCRAGAYARKHAPWVDYAALPATTNRPFSAFPSTYSRLPSVAFVVPDLDNDMHDGSVARGDAWVRRHLGDYATWARTHNSLLVVTWDEDDRSAGNRVPTIIDGQGVHAQQVTGATTLYSLLRLVEDRLRLARLGGAHDARAIVLR